MRISRCGCVNQPRESPLVLSCVENDRETEQNTMTSHRVRRMLIGAASALAMMAVLPSVANARSYTRSQPTAGASATEVKVKPSRKRGIRTSLTELELTARQLAQLVGALVVLATAVLALLAVLGA
jgi:hypothetical protein